MVASAWLSLNVEGRLSTVLLTSLLEASRVKIVKDVPRFTFLDDSYGPYKEGDETDIPRLLALPLIGSGFARAIDEGMELELFKVLSREKSDQQRGGMQLTPLKPGFFKRLLFLLLAMGGDEKVRRLESIYQDLITLRLSKIIRPLGYTSIPQSIPGISDEEKVLYEDLSTIVSAWRRAMRGEETWR